MSKGRSKSKRRDASDITNRRLPLKYKLRSAPQSNVHHRSAPVSQSPTVAPLRPNPGLWDARQWTPTPPDFRGDRDFPRSKPGGVYGSPSAPVRARSRSYDYHDPGVVHVGRITPEEAVCVRRSQRKEVLHALGRTGRGSSRSVPVFTNRSKVRCK